MANMNYCRFENTYVDFKDCVNALEECDLNDLSQSELKYANELYQLAKTYVGIYEMQLESNQAPQPNSNRDMIDFLAYYRVQMTGEYNMITEKGAASQAAGLSLDTYNYIQSNYSTLKNMYPSECACIERMVMDQIKMDHEG